MIRLRLLGSIALHGEDGRELASVLAQPKRLALLVYLAAARPRGFHRRDKLIALFWPDFEQARARQALNKSVHVLRRFIGDAAILSRGDQELALDDAVVQCDVRVFEDAIAAGSPRAALEAYGGSFADGLFVDDAAEFEHWLSAEREWLQSTAAKAAASLADTAPDPTAGIEWARRAAELAPYDEPVVRRLMVALDRTADRAGAVRVYDEFARRLSADLELAPSDETRALRDALGKSGDASSKVASVPESRSPITPLKRSELLSHVPPVAPRERLVWPYAAAISVLAILAAIAFARRPSTATPASGLDARRLLVAVLENRTGDSTLNVLGAMASDWMAQGINAADLIRVVDSRDALLMSNAATRNVSGVAKASGAGFVISGAYYKQGDTLRFQVQLTNAINGEGSRAFQPVAASVHNPAAALEPMREQALSLVAQAISPHQARLLRGSPKPPLYAAYREYIEGINSYVHRNLPAAYDHFVHAAELDTTFTVALLGAAASMEFVAPKATDSIIAKLARTRDALSPISRDWLDMMTAERRGDVLEVHRLVGELAREAPDSFFPYMYAQSFLILGRIREARTHLGRIDPDKGWMNGWFSYWVSRAMVDHLLGDSIAEQQDIQRGVNRYPRDVAIATAAARWFASTGRAAQLDSLLDESVSMLPKPGWNAGSVMAVAALEAAAHGHPELVDRVRTRALAWYRARPSNERDKEAGFFGLTWMLHSVAAWPELEERVAWLAREAPSDPRWLVLQGIIHAQRGDTAVARRIDRVLQARIQSGAEATRERPTLVIGRARIAAMLGERDATVELLRQALAHGWRFSVYLHTDPAFVAMREYPPLARLINPRQ